MKDVEVIQSKASKGGAVAMTGGKLIMEDSAFFRNKAHTSGGALWLEGTKLKMNGSKLAHSDAEEGDGGGIWTTGVFIIEDSRIVHGEAARKGGGLFSKKRNSQNRIFQLEVKDNMTRGFKDDGIDIKGKPFIQTIGDNQFIVFLN